MISKKDLQIQKMMQILIDLHDMGDDLVSSIEKANYKACAISGTPTEHMKIAVAKWKGFWEEKK